MANTPGERVPVSIVCVYNDADVLESCLKRSVDAGLASAPGTEFIGVDNRAGRFPTAGAALNHGAASAHNDVVVFVHQDVVLHDLPALEAVAAVVEHDPAIGVLGSVGVDGTGRVIGRMRDRVVQIGEPAPRPRDIDSLDEVLFMISRQRVLAEPISTDPELAWHAYAVEYAARVRSQGLRAVAMDIPITHNSLTVNLARLDVAHQHVGRLFPASLPIHTTCGVIRDDEPGFHRNLRRLGRLAIWWRESVTAVRAGSARPGARVVLADIRLLVDQAAELAGADVIHARDVAGGTGEPTAADDLVRLGRRFDARTATLADVDREIAQLPPHELLLVTNVPVAGLRELPSLDWRPSVIGVWDDLGVWALAGASADELAPLWADRRNRPFAGVWPARAGDRAGRSASKRTAPAT
jgi:hypothetical protein